MRKRVGSAIALCCAAVCILLAARVIWMAATGGESLTIAVVSAGLALGLALGLIRHSRWALRTLAAMFLLAAIILPAGIFSPFTAGDYLAARREPPTVSTTLEWLVPVEVVLLLIAFVVDPSNEKHVS